MTKKLNLITITLLLLINTNYSQIDKEVEINNNFKNNSIYFNPGIGGFWFTGTLYYERIIKQGDKPIYPIVRTGIGGVLAWETFEYYALAQFGLLTGKNKHHFEFFIGPNYFLTNSMEQPYISGSLGWRIQKPDEMAIFRMGIGFPEGLYIGCGIYF